MSHEDGGTSWCDSCVGKVVKLTFHYSSPKCIVIGYFSVKEDSNFQTVAPECDFFVIAMSFSVVFFLFSFSCPKTVSFRKPCLAEIFVTCDLLNNAHMVRFLGNISVLIKLTVDIASPVCQWSQWDSGTSYFIYYLDYLCI